MGFITVPLYRIWVSSDLVSGCFNVAARSSLPVKGIDFIMGNDLAGGKVMPVVHVTKLHVLINNPMRLHNIFQMFLLLV